MHGVNLCVCVCECKVRGKVVCGYLMNAMHGYICV